MMYYLISLADAGNAFAAAGQTLHLRDALALGRVRVVNASLNGERGVPPMEWWHFADLSAVPQSAVTFQLPDGRTIRATAIDLDREDVELFLAPPPPLSEHRFDRAAFEERVRRSAEQGAHVPGSRSVPQWPPGESRIRVTEAALLLETCFPPAPLAKPNDSDLRSELIKNVRESDKAREILRLAREVGGLIHPTLGIPEPCPGDAEKDWFIGPETFETIRNKLLGSSANVPEGSVAGVGEEWPGTRTAGVDDFKDAAPNKRGPVSKKRTEATARMIEAVRNGEMTASQLRGMKQKELEKLYPDGKRTMLVEAREEALKMFRQNPGKTPTNDK
jgi:hypothetical protein